MLQILTIIDNASGCPWLAAIISKHSECVEKKTDLIWFCRCLQPQECTHENDTEFAGLPFQEMLRSCGIKSAPTAVKNPEVSVIIDRLH